MGCRFMNKKTRHAVDDAVEELLQASKDHPSFRSEHEGYAIMLEEVDELWDEVKKRPSKRNVNRLRAEAKQVAATALRFMVDLT
jgi:hypothetical protein